MSPKEQVAHIKRNGNEDWGKAFNAHRLNALVHSLSDWPLLAACVCTGNEL